MTEQGKNVRVKPMYEKVYLFFTNWVRNCSKNEKILPTKNKKGIDTKLFALSPAKINKSIRPLF